MILAPRCTQLEQWTGTLAAQGHVVLAPDALHALAGLDAGALGVLGPAWDDLPPDAHLRDGGRYRRRRHGCFEVTTDAVAAAPHRAHWQPLAYNALHGGFERWFAPLVPPLAGSDELPALLRAFAGAFTALRGVPRWFVEAHAFRIDTTDGIGRPTPEGAHRDGVDFVVVCLVARAGVKGGETRVFEGATGLRFTITEPWTALVLDDARVVHETTPVQPTGGLGHRDTLVLTYRANGFQGPA